MAEEVAHRAQTRINRSVRKARFPVLRTIEDLDFTFRTATRLQLLGSCLGPELVSEAAILSCAGPRARARLTSHSPSLNGSEALFTSAAALIESLSVASRRGDLAATLARYTADAWSSYAARRNVPGAFSVPNPSGASFIIQGQNVRKSVAKVPEPTLASLVIDATPSSWYMP